MGRRIYVRSGSGNGMKFWPRNWWPHTLSAQLVAVTTAAVLVSNLAAGLWFENTQKLLTETSLRDRVADRAASTATLLSGIPAHEREEAVHAMSSGLWYFQLQYGHSDQKPMTADGARLSQRVRLLLQPQRARQPVSVRMGMGEMPPNPTQGQPKARKGPGIEITAPVVRNPQLVGRFLKPPPPPWPTEVVIAGIVALLTTSLAAA